MATSDAYRKGCEAFRNNPDRMDNPYPVGSEYFNEFERAWVQCLKREAADCGARRSATSFAKDPAAPQLGSSFPSYEAPKTDEQRKAEAAIAYAQAKGGG